jgi:hypothetical protein
MNTDAHPEIDSLGWLQLWARSKRATYPSAKRAFMVIFDALAEPLPRSLVALDLPN